MAVVTLNGHVLTEQQAGFLRIDEDALHVLANQHGAGMAREDFEVSVAVSTSAKEYAVPDDVETHEQPYVPDSHPPKDEGNTNKKPLAKPSGSAGKAVHVDGPTKTVMTGSIKDANRTQKRVDIK